MGKIQEITRNPLNIRYNKKNVWRGQTGEYKGFCVFENESYGIRAAFKLLTNYRKKGYNTIRKIIERWAPHCENDTEKYIEFVSKDVMIEPDDLITFRSIHDYWTLIIILRAMAKMECGKWYDEQLINLYINYPEKYV